MVVNVQIDGAYADEELRSLHAWLRNEQHVRENSTIEYASNQPQDGEMGATLDLITLITTGTLQLPTFIQALVDWRRTRRREYPITVELDGARVLIPNASDDLVLKVVQELESRD